MNLTELTSAAHGRLIGGAAPGWEMRGLTSDSRSLSAGDVFVALRGERFDGNDYLEEAISRGASVVICARGRALDRGGVAFIETDDTLRALGDVAAAHRRRFDIPLVAITGSNGKTTTKELLRAVLGAAFGADRVLANPGNLNNQIGLPLSLLKLDRDHRAAVLEMGMNAPGEIARLAEIAAPSVGVITCVGAAHLEGVGSLEGVANAKGELYAGLPPGATAVVNADDPWVTRVSSRFAGRKLTFGRDADVRARSVEPLAIDRTRFVLETPAGSAPVEIPLAGRHNVSNALAAAAAAVAVGVTPDSIAAGLAAVTPPPMRLAVERLANGVAIVNDAYNANPSSLRAALEAMADLSPERLIVVLGEMRELGSRSAELHTDAGRDVAKVGPVLLCAVGAQAANIAAGALAAGMADKAVVAVETHDAAADVIARAWRDGDIVLVKGSRGAQMERVVETLRRRVPQ